MAKRKDNRTIDDFWEYRLTPCKTSCKDYSPYQSGKVVSEGAVDSWTWQYKKPKPKQPEEEKEQEPEDNGPRIWRNV